MFTFSIGRLIEVETIEDITVYTVETTDGTKLEIHCRDEEPRCEIFAFVDSVSSADIKTYIKLFGYAQLQSVVQHQVKRVKFFISILFFKQHIRCVIEMQDVSAFLAVQKFN